MQLYRQKTTRHLLLLAGGVIILLVLSCFLGLTVKQESMIKSSVYLSAQRLFESIVLTRRWNAQYGGVFVQKKTGMLSNPYLEHPDISTASGLIYTLKNPALMTREISLLAEQSGHYRYHITSLKLMNLANVPDNWERESLEKFEQGVEERVQVAVVDGQQVYRFMRPLVVEDGCMSCHGKQGYQRGEVRGGISVSLPYKDIAAHLGSNRIKMAGLALSIIGIFIFLFYFVIWRLVGHLFSISGELKEQKQQLEYLNADLDEIVNERTLALQESEQRFRLLFEQAPVGICHIGLNGQILRVNDRFCEIFGYEVSQLLAKQFQDISFDAKKISMLGEWEELLIGEKDSFTLEQPYLRADNFELWVYLTISLIRRESGEPRYFICVVEDRSERRNLQLQLQQAQKMEAMGTLAGGIAHDFNNILTPILGYTEMLMEDSQANEKQYNSLQAVFNAATRAQELIRQILTFSRRNDTEQHPLNITLVVKEVLKLLRSFLPSSVEICHLLTKEDCIVRANPTQIHQVMMNLCTNAYQAMEEGSGTLTVELDIQHLENTEELLSLPAGRYGVLLVKDTGCGMDAITIERMYEPYFTTKDKGEGTGLGLAMVHAIVEDLGGAIEVVSTPGKGTCFTVYFPIVVREPTSRGVAALPLGEGIPGGEESILLVDDEPAIVSMQTIMLEELGYHITSLSNPVRALELFREDASRFDLVISDISMPEMSGVLLAKEINKLRADIPILLITGFSAEYSREIFKLNAVHGLLTKPILKQDLARSVRQALDKNTK
nr:ATP-binding protein [uncultured Desulfobulbus sp.]